jgi:predicted GNAT family acetyltransferase
MQLLSEADRAEAIAFASQEPEANVFIIGDIENHGMQGPGMSVWGERGGDGRLIALYLQLYDSSVFYAPGVCDDASWIGLMRERDFRFLSGAAFAVERFVDAFAWKSVRRMSLCRLTAQGRRPAPDAPPGLRPLTAGDVGLLAELYAEVPGFRASEHLRGELEASHCSGFWIEHEGRMASAGLTSGENSRSAMIVGVATRPDARGRGFATAVMTAICHDQLSKGHSVCLFYDNPVAGRVYHGLGFETIGQYALFERTPMAARNS